MSATQAETVRRPLAVSQMRGADRLKEPELRVGAFEVFVDQVKEQVARRPHPRVQSGRPTNTVRRMADFSNPTALEMDELREANGHGAALFARSLFGPDEIRLPGQHRCSGSRRLVLDR
jgi:hypothetical protein